MIVVKDPNNFIAARLASLRTERNVSARDMSLTIGQSASYINSIESGKNLPSITGLYYVCDYFGIEPRDFFDSGVGHPALQAEIIRELEKLSKENMELVLHLVKALAK